MLGLGVMLMVIAHQVWLQARGWRFNAMSPYFLVDFLTFTLIGLGSLVEPLPHRSLHEEILFSVFVLSGLAAYYLGLHFPYAAVHKRWLVPAAARIPLLRLFSLFSIQTLLLLLSITGVVAFLLVQRMSALGLSFADMLSLSVLQIHAQVATEGLGALPVIIVYIITVMVLIHLYRLLQMHHYAVAFGFYVVLTVSYLLIASTRIPVLLCLSAPLAYYHYTIRRINRLLLVALLVGAPVAITLLQGLRSNALFAWTVSDRLVAEIIVMKSFHTLWQRYVDGSVHLEWGANYYYYSPLTFVPKALWAEKPQTSFETRWTMNLFGSLLDEDGQISVHTFTPWGEGLVQFGWLGGVVNLFLYGLILSYAIRFLGNRPHACMVYYFYAVLAATFVRTSVQALAFTTLLYLVAVWLYEAIFMKRPSSEEVIAQCAS
ncbi:MAG: hypothetical protein K6U77_05350 [Armatimonadetes bacterium]|nr:hypothetical protein [Armatimonadota bacterium]